MLKSGYDVVPVFVFTYELRHRLSIMDIFNVRKICKTQIS